LDARRTGLAEGAATLLSSHADHPRPATSDTTKRKSGHSADSLEASQLAAGRDLLLSVGRHRRAESEQQASKRWASRAASPRPLLLRSARHADRSRLQSASGLSVSAAAELVEQLKDIARLRAERALIESEFEAVKARLLSDEASA
jgi:hypothetical protein